MITYAQFLQAATNDDLWMLNQAALKQTIATQSAAQADAWLATLTRLFTNGLLTRGERAWEVKDGITWYTFDAVVHPEAVPFLLQLQVDRLVMSREPLP